MQHLKLFSSVLLSACLAFSCAGNNTTNSNNDSSSANSSSSVAGSGGDMYYELTTTATGKHMSMKGVTKMYVSSKGAMRSEMNFSNSLNPNAHSAPIVVIGHSDKPDQSIIIDDSAKTFTINHINRGDLDTKEKIQSTVTKAGEENIMGFHCVHARVISNKSIGKFYSQTDTLDLWRSNSVPMQATVKDLMNQFESRTGNFMYSKEVADQLKQMGCEGFMVKLTIKSKDVSTIVQLTKVEHRDLPVSMFAVPAGYTEDKNGM
jgi:hypothetical protein